MASQVISYAELAAAVLAAPPRLGATRLVTIDGPAGSGKTTLAAHLAAAVGGDAGPAPVVHMDDLYEGWDRGLDPVLGGRLDAWLLTPLAAGLPARHLRYDWYAGRFAAWVEVPPHPVLILEGVGSGQRVTRPAADLRIWIEAPRSTRLTRGLERDGEHLSAEWLAWQTREAAHFAAEDTRAAATVIVDGITPPHVDRSVAVTGRWPAPRA